MVLTKAGRAAIVLAALAGCSSPVLDAIDPPAGRAPFEVRGPRIHAPDGAELVIKGVNINGPGWVWSRDMVADADHIARTWRFNLVRAMTRLPRPGVGSSTNDADALVQAFTSRRVIVLFAPTDHAGSYYTATSAPSLDELAGWHRTMAARYRSNPYVWFEAQGAPGPCEVSAEWLTSHRRIVQAIRDEAGASNVIVLHGGSYGADDGCVRGDNAPASRSAILTHGRDVLAAGGRSYRNVVFAFSVLWPKSVAKMQDQVDRIQAAGLPVFVAQLGGRYYGAEDISSGVEAVFTVGVPRRVGRVAYAWYDGHGGAESSNALTTAGNGTTGAAVDDALAPTNLSWLGKLVWADTHRTDGM